MMRQESRRWRECRGRRWRIAPAIPGPASGALASPSPARALPSAPTVAPPAPAIGRAPTTAPTQARHGRLRCRRLSPSRYCHYCRKSRVCARRARRAAPGPLRSAGHRVGLPRAQTRDRRALSIARHPAVHWLRPTALLRLLPRAKHVTQLSPSVRRLRQRRCRAASPNARGRGPSAPPCLAMSRRNETGTGQAQQGHGQQQLVPCLDGSRAFLPALQRRSAARCGHQELGQSGVGSPLGAVNAPPMSPPAYPAGPSLIHALANRYT